MPRAPKSCPGGRSAGAKRVARKQAVVAGLRLRGPAGAAADGERESGTEGAKELSRRAQRRREKCEQQRRRRQQLADKTARTEDEAFLRLARRVERLKQAPEGETVVRQDLESLTEDLRQALDKHFPEEQGGGSSRERRRPKPMGTELASRLMGSAQRGEKLRREIAHFVESVAADTTAPASGPFADAMLQAMLAGKRFECDQSAAGEVYGPFADAFHANDWSDPLLQRVARQTILATAVASA